MIHNNTKKYSQSNGLVTGVELLIEEIPNSKYKVKHLRLIDEVEAKGKTIAYCKSPSQLYLCWPYRKGHTSFENEVKIGSEAVISNGFNPPDYGWLAIKTENGDVVGGLGLPFKHHVSFEIEFEQRTITEPDKPSDLEKRVELLESRVKHIEDYLDGFSI